MKRKFLAHTIIALCMTGSLLVSSSVAQDASGNMDKDSSSTFSTTSRSSEQTVRASQLLGSTVKDQQGNTLGQVNDFIVQPTFGRIQFVVVSLNDQSGKLTAVPWQLVRRGTDPATCMVIVDKQKLSGSQTFESTSWPDFSQQSTCNEIYSYYGIQPNYSVITVQPSSTYTISTQPAQPVQSTTYGTQYYTTPQYPAGVGAAYLGNVVISGSGWEGNTIGQRSQPDGKGTLLKGSDYNRDYNH